MGLQNYRALCAWHIVKMKVLYENDHATWVELESGKWAPNKTDVSFCSLGADEAMARKIVI